MVAFLSNITEGLRMLVRAHAKIPRYAGSAQQISEQIIDRCWTGEFFATSAGHFSAFYCRDFGMCTQALIELGHKEKVVKTLHWALAHFKANKAITTTITRDGRCVDFFGRGIDSLAFFARSIRLTNDETLIQQSRAFLQMQAALYAQTLFVDGHLVDEYISSIRDHYHRRRSCYDACMTYLAATQLDALGVSHTLWEKKEASPQMIRRLYARRAGFLDDISPDARYAGDAQVFAVYCGVCTTTRDKVLMIRAIRRLSLDTPFPLKYDLTRQTHKEILPQSLLAPNYEGSTIWPHLGLCFIESIIKQKSIASHYLQQYEHLITEHGNFLEVYTANGTPYRTALYQTDHSMLWASHWLWLQTVAVNQSKQKNVRRTKIRFTS